MKNQMRLLERIGGHGFFFGGWQEEGRLNMTERGSKKETTFTEIYHGAGGGHGEDVTMSWLLIPPVLGIYPLPTVPTVGTMFKGAVLSENVLLKPSGWCMLLYPMKASI